jgi:DNA replication protein DnaC
MEIVEMFESIKSLSHELRLFGVHRSVERRCGEALADSLHPSELVRLLLQDEKDQRKEAAGKRLTSRAQFRNGSVLESFDMSFERGITKQKLKELSLLNFFHKKENLLIIGKTGVGKTNLAIALGKKLCEEGETTSFYSSNLMFEEALAERAAGRYLKWIQRMKKITILILDDFALRNYTHEEANTLLEIIEERYQKGITIVTSQVSPAGWSGLFEDPVIAEAIVDRLKNPASVVELKGESYRKRLGS